MSGTASSSATFFSLPSFTANLYTVDEKTKKRKRNEGEDEKKREVAIKIKLEESDQKATADKQNNSILNCSDKIIDANKMRDYINELKKAAYSTINFSGSRISNKAFAICMNMLKKAVTITGLDLSYLDDDNLTEKTLELLMTTLKEVKEIQSLDLSYNATSFFRDEEKALREEFKILSANLPETSVVELSLAGCYLDDLEIKCLRSCSMQVLNLDGNYIGKGNQYKALDTIVCLLQRMPKLRSLSIKENQCTLPSFEYLVKTLQAAVIATKTDRIVIIEFDYKNAIKIERIHGMQSTTLIDITTDPPTPGFIGV